MNLNKNIEALNELNKSNELIPIKFKYIQKKMAILIHTSFVHDQKLYFIDI